MRFAPSLTWDPQVRGGGSGGGSAPATHAAAAGLITNTT